MPADVDVTGVPVAGVLEPGLVCQDDVDEDAGTGDKADVVAEAVDVVSVVPLLAAFVLSRLMGNIQ